ncbi:MAG: 16S rRNA (guanine(527)-N(7))-methyltransferase RsmG [Candidatus Nanopelagicales bacterium]
MSAVSRETEGLRELEQFLAGPGIERGLIGPREADRLWDRHILNCAVVAWENTLVPASARVVDVGSGAGLPGVVWAVARPDLRVTCVESLQRRATFLSELVAHLGLGARVSVVRSRAEDLPTGEFDVATARAVAPLPRLLPWLAPLTRGTVVAFKGRMAAQEVAAAAEVADRLGLTDPEVLQVGGEIVNPPTTVVRYHVRST